MLLLVNELAELRAYDYFDRIVADSEKKRTEGGSKERGTHDLQTKSAIV